MNKILERRIDNCYIALDNAQEDWGKNYWATVLVILLRQMRSEKPTVHYIVVGVLMVTLTEAAREYLKGVGKPNVYLSVQGGGCSGFTYVWDTTEEKPTVENLHVDPIAEMYVLGCTIDYVKELGGSFLKVINPNATAQCGCGESFGV